MVIQDCGMRAGLARTHLSPWQAAAFSQRGGCGSHKESPVILLLRFRLNSEAFC